MLILMQFLMVNLLVVFQLVDLMVIVGMGCIAVLVAVVVGKGSLEDNLVVEMLGMVVFVVVHMVVETVLHQMVVEVVVAVLVVEEDVAVAAVVHIEDRRVDEGVEDLVADVVLALVPVEVVAVEIVV